MLMIAHLNISVKLMGGFEKIACDTYLTTYESEIAAILDGSESFGQNVDLAPTTEGNRSI